MFKIKEHNFPIVDSSLYGKKHYFNWPVIYLLDDKKQIYIGETYNLLSRMKQHSDNPEKQGFNRVHVIYDDEFNKSATLDIESTLIKYMSSDQKFIVTNKNDGLVNADYYQRDAYKDKSIKIWNHLKKIGIVQKEIIEIENSDIFKFSPYKALSTDQLEVTALIRDDLLKKQESGEKGVYFINGLPGSGKTVLATYLMKYLSQCEELKLKKVALVISMTSLRTTIRKTFKYVDGLKPSMVIGPSDLHKDEYDLLIVDESHRLRKRKNIVNYESFDNVNLAFGLDNNGDELDWIKLSSKHIILFYDENQSVRPSDISHSKYMSLGPTFEFTLQSQFRVKAGMEFVYYISNIFNNRQIKKQSFDEYECGIVLSFNHFNDIIKEKQAEFGLSLMVSGYSYEWVSKKNKSLYDIEIEGIKKQWNTVAIGFVFSPNAHDEVGCIHTIQGYELNYVGVIIGADIDYDFDNKEIIINPNMYFDRNGKVSTSIDQLKKYIQNIYVTLSTRGINGVYFYVVNDNMRAYMMKYFNEIIK